MLNAAIQHRIISALHGTVLSTSMVSRKTRLSRITVAKYLHALEQKGSVQAVRIGKAVAWRTTERKPIVAILAKTGTARMIKLALGDRYQYALATNPSLVQGAFAMVTDNPQYARSTDVPVVLIGHHDEQAYCLPELFVTSTLKTLVKKLYYEQHAPLVHATASIVLEHFDAFEEALGIHAADELLKLTARPLRENRVPVKQYERTTFLIDGDLPPGALLDIEQTFHLLLAHVYGRMVTPGERITADTVSHIVPSLTITLGPAFDELHELEH